MNRKEYFEKYYSKLSFEALIKSLLCGIVVGFGANFITAFVFWMIGTGFMGLWISIGVAAVATLASTIAVYFAKFRPTVESNAKRIDRLGLEERLITMVEFASDNSYLANAQRADAKAALAKVESRQITLRIPQKLMIIALIVFIVGALMTTVTGLTAAGIIAPGNNIIDDMIPDEPDVFVPVTYLVEEGGFIEGDEAQLVLLGGNADSVLAIADDGYSFEKWSDGYKKPNRSDRNVVNEMEIFAIFKPVGDGLGIGEEGEGQPKPAPNGQPGENGAPNPDANNPGDKPGDKNESSMPSNFGGGKYDDCNQVIDGETWYGEIIDAYAEAARDQVSEKGDEFSSEQREVIESYINIV